MDAIVEAALKKWPNVPHCYGWLALDARGDWYMRDDRIRAAGPFPQIKGSRIVHDKLQAFIGRNYAADERGCWFFQNGPQRVYVELEAAPWVWRLTDTTDTTDTATGCTLTSHTGRRAVARSCWLDDFGRLFLDSDLGLGLVHSLDMETAADAILRGEWTPQDLPFSALPARFGYRLQPQGVEDGDRGMHP
ncbi:MAG: DUF2946 family protein [Rubrivivax sp.]|nr:DUF2946 family protein [Rubrivivax sp.]